MAVSTWGVNADEAVKLWSRKTMHEALKRTVASKFMGEGSDSLCTVMDDLQKSAGDRVRTILRMQLTGAGILGDETLEGNEEALVTYADNVTINQLRHAVRSGGKMSEQRVPFSVREEARQALQDWWSASIDTSFFNQIAGASTVTDTRLTGMNATTAPDSNHQIYAGVATAESNLSADSSQTFSLASIDAAVVAARTLTPVIRPLNDEQEPGKHMFVQFVTPEMHFDLRRNTTTGEWQDIMKQLMTGGGGKDNPIVSGALGEYNGVVLHESFRLPRITTGGGANQGGRSVFCGAQAAAVAFGRGSSRTRMSWNEEMFDYGNQLGVSTAVTYGLKKCIFNALDFGTIVSSAQHSAAARTASKR